MATFPAPGAAAVGLLLRPLRRSPSLSCRSSPEGRTRVSIAQKPAAPLFSGTMWPAASTSTSDAEVEAESEVEAEAESGVIGRTHLQDDDGGRRWTARNSAAASLLGRLLRMPRIGSGGHAKHSL